VTWQQWCRERPAAVYRLFDADDRLLYVGCSESMRTRLNAHRCEKDWFPTVTRTTVQGFPTREEALAAELAAIRSEAPVHNVKGKVTETHQTVDLYFRIERALRLPYASSIRIGSDQGRPSSCKPLGRLSWL
jgi:predicted GIY-YIG superfamily endonuclease